METFNVGQVCIGQNFIMNPERNRMECEILESAKPRVAFDAAGDLVRDTGYFVRWSDGDTAFVRPKNLRRKPPPQTGEQSILALFKPMPQREGVAA